MTQDFTFLECINCKTEKKVCVEICMWLTRQSLDSGRWSHHILSSRRLPSSWRSRRPFWGDDDVSGSESASWSRWKDDAVDTCAEGKAGTAPPETPSNTCKKVRSISIKYREWSSVTNAVLFCRLFTIMVQVKKCFFTDTCLRFYSFFFDGVLGPPCLSPRTTHLMVSKKTIDLAWPEQYFLTEVPHLFLTSFCVEWRHYFY